LKIDIATLVHSPTHPAMPLVFTSRVVAVESLF
jgi:hypothetical protein